MPATGHFRCFRGFRVRTTGRNTEKIYSTITGSWMEQARCFIVFPM